MNTKRTSVTMKRIKRNPQIRALEVASDYLLKNPYGMPKTGLNVNNYLIKLDVDGNVSITDQNHQGVCAL